MPRYQAAIGVVSFLGATSNSNAAKSAEKSTEKSAKNPHNTLIIYQKGTVEYENFYREMEEDLRYNCPALELVVGSSDI